MDEIDNRSLFCLLPLPDPVLVPPFRFLFRATLSIPTKVSYGFELLTSQTLTVPSWLATAYRRPSEDQAVLKHASEKTAACVVIGSKWIEDGPEEEDEEREWRYTEDVSPTVRRVRPSGDTDATRNKHHDIRTSFPGIRETKLEHAPWLTRVSSWTLPATSNLDSALFFLFVVCCR